MTNSILSFVLTLIINYGYPVVALAIVCGYLGVPIPTEAIVLAAGSFSNNGSLNIYLLIALITVVSVTCDFSWYLISRKYGDAFITKITSKIGINHDRLEHVHSFLKKWGIWAIFFTRWLITPLGTPLNIVAGLSKYSPKRFLVVAAIGETLWASIYGILGYQFGANWQSVLEYLNNLPLIIALFVLGITAIIIYKKISKKEEKSLVLE